MAGILHQCQKPQSLTTHSFNLPHRHTLHLSSHPPWSKLQTRLNRLPDLLRLRTCDTILDIAILENTERRHAPDSQLLRNVLTLLDIVEVELDIRVLINHLCDFGCDDFALLTPCCCAFKDGYLEGVSGLVGSQGGG
jgi:hypothetical protein